MASVSVSSPAGFLPGSVGNEPTSPWLWEDQILGAEPVGWPPEPPAPFQTSFVVPPDAFALADQTVVEALVLSMPPGPQGSCVPDSLFAIEVCSSAVLVQEVIDVRTNIPDEPEPISFSIASATVPPQGCFVDWLVEDISAPGTALSHDLPWSGQVYLPGPAVELDIVQVQVHTDVKVPAGFPSLDPGKLQVSAFLLDASGTPRIEPRYSVDPITVDVNLDCTCDVMQLGMGVVAKAGGVEASYQAQIRNVSNETCTYQWELRQTGTFGRANLNIPFSGGELELAPDEVFDLLPPIFVELPTGAPREAQLQLQVWDRTGKTCEWDPDHPKKALVRNDLVCVLPTAEEAEWLQSQGQGGWICDAATRGDSNSLCSPVDPGFTLATFRGNVQPALARFGGRSVKEVLYPATAFDPCFDARTLTWREGSRKCGRMGSFKGKGMWSVDSEDNWGRDGLVDAVGHASGCIDAYRAEGYGSNDPTATFSSCTLIVKQDMAIQCFGGRSGLPERWVTYSEGALSINWDESSVWATRAQGDQTPQLAGPKAYP